MHIYEPHIEDRRYLVPIGGKIEFGERSIETVKREVMEEINAEITNEKLLAVIENLFVYGGDLGHELAFVFEAEFVDKSFYERDQIIVTEINGVQNIARWYDLDWLREEHLPTYPDGLLDLL